MKDLTRAQAHCSGPIRFDLGNPDFLFLPDLDLTEDGFVFHAPIPRLYTF